MKEEKSKKTPLIRPYGGEISTESLKECSPVELADALEEMLGAMSEETYDPELVAAYLEALEKKAPIGAVPDAQTAEASFRRGLGAFGGELSAQNAVPARRARRRYRFPAAVAATVALLFALMLCAQAAGFDVFGSLARWTSETFRFTPAIQQETEVSPYYEPLRQALGDNGILWELAPKWYPEGFVGLEPVVEKNKFNVTVFTKFQDASGKEFSVLITRQSPSESLETMVYEKDEASVETYMSGERSFYIFSNARDTTMAMWSDGGFEESICGELSVEEVQKIIDSIGG